VGKHQESKQGVIMNSSTKYITAGSLIYCFLEQLKHALLKFLLSRGSTAIIVGRCHSPERNPECALGIMPECALGIISKVSLKLIRASITSKRDLSLVIKGFFCGQRLYQNRTPDTAIVLLN